MKKNLLKRSLSALFFLVILLSGILINEYFYFGVFIIITIISQFELYRLLKKGDYPSQNRYGVLIGFVIFVLSFFVAQDMLPPTSYFLAILLILILFISQLYYKNEDHFKSIAFTLFGIVYIVLPLSALTFIAFSGINNDQYTYDYILAMFIMIWVNDSGAYIIGSLIGKRKLFERISPKKTWEGTAGGFLVTLIAAYIISFSFTDLKLYEWMIFAVIVVVFGTYGDLVESLLKRKVGVKDSGNIMPGHGGLLDRFDSTFFVAPMIFLYLKVLEYFF